jgi:hypothetical protein
VGLVAPAMQRLALVVERLAFAKEPGHPQGAAALTPQAIQRILTEEVGQALQRTITAQLAKSLSDDPAAVTSYVDERVRAEMEQQKEQAGGYRRLLDRFSQQGLTLEQYETEQRTQTMSEVFMYYKVRVPGQSTHLITPTEIRRYYRANQDQFGRPATTSVAVLKFAGGDDGKSKAEAAMEQLGSGAVDAVANTTGAVLGRFSGVHQQSDHLPALRAAVAGQPTGAVVGPLLVGSEWWVLRIEEVDSGRAGGFEENDVQQEIIKRLQDLQFARHRQRLVDQILRTAEVWHHPSLGR